MEIFTKIWPFWIYLFGLPIAYALTEKENYSIRYATIIFWPYGIPALFLYKLTKKLINYLKHIKWLKM